MPLQSLAKELDTYIHTIKYNNLMHVLRTYMVKEVARFLLFQTEGREVYSATHGNSPTTSFLI